MNLFTMSTPIDEKRYTALQLKTSDGDFRQLIVKKSPCFDCMDWDFIWSDVVWMYWEKQKNDGEGIRREKLDLNWWIERDELVDEYFRLKKLMGK